MKLFKTSQYRDIVGVEVESFNEKTFTVKLSNLRPDSPSCWKDNDRTFTLKRFDSQVNYHETFLDAQNFVFTRLSDKIIKLESDLEKNKLLILNFK